MGFHLEFLSAVSAPSILPMWEEEKKEDGIKWMQLEHRGPYFVPPYEPLPKDVQFYYDGTAVVGPGPWGGALSSGNEKGHFGKRRCLAAPVGTAGTSMGLSGILAP
ncbi:hypothetical protein EK904_004424 [Melospiza melodia maxima]|nr:hypothetical protein EK904_004424 [Melospiza melodia maxima]